MEKYWDTKRELETLRQRLSTERDDELETLQASKRSLEKKVWFLVFLTVCVCVSECVSELVHCLSLSLSLSWQTLRLRLRK